MSAFITQKENTHFDFPIHVFRHTLKNYSRKADRARQQGINVLQKQATVYEKPSDLLKHYFIEKASGSAHALVYTITKGHIKMLPWPRYLTTSHTQEAKITDSPTDQLKQQQ